MFGSQYKKVWFITFVKEILSMLRHCGMRNLTFITKCEERLTLTQASWSRPSVYPSLAWSGKENFYYSLVGMLVHLYTWVKGGHCESEVVFQRTQHSTVTSAWAPTQTTRSRVHRENHRAIASPSKFKVRYQTRETVFHQDIQTPRRESWKYDAQRSIFWRNSRCLDIWWNSVSSVWYIFSIEAKTNE